MIAKTREGGDELARTSTFRLEVGDGKVEEYGCFRAGGGTTGLAAWIDAKEAKKKGYERVNGCAPDLPLAIVCGGASRAERRNDTPVLCESAKRRLNENGASSEVVAYLEGSDPPCFRDGDAYLCFSNEARGEVVVDGAFATFLPALQAAPGVSRGSLECEPTVLEMGNGSGVRLQKCHRPTTQGATAAAESSVPNPTIPSPPPPSSSPLPLPSPHSAQTGQNRKNDEENYENGSRGGRDADGGGGAAVCRLSDLPSSSSVEGDVSCKFDADCLVSDDVVFQQGWKNVLKPSTTDGRKGAGGIRLDHKTSLQDLVDGVNYENEESGVDVRLTTTTTKRADRVEKFKDLRRLKTRAEKAFREDPAFRDSLRRQVVHSLSSSSASICDATRGVCRLDRSSLPAPTDRLFDGSAAVVLSSLGDDGETVVAHRKGATHEVAHEAWNGRRGAGRGAVLEGGDGGTVVLEPGKTAVRDEYLVRFRGGVTRRVSNGVARNDGKDCSSSLCSLNADTCPLPLCERRTTTETGTTTSCVPRTRSR